MDTPMQRSSSSSGARILKLHLRRADAAGEVSAAVWVRAEGWVDLGLVGRAVGVDPATVRLNGYFLSRGRGTHDRGHVSSSLTWGSLLSFFAARALPCGASPAAPVAVHGQTLNPKPPATSPDVGDHSARCKRDGELQDDDDDESPLKKNRIAEGNSVAPKGSGCRRRSGGGDDDDDDDGILGMKRRLRLDDNHPTLKKPKTSEFRSSGSAAVSKTLFSYSCIDAHGKKKRAREEEMMVSSISHKRVR